MTDTPPKLRRMKSWDHRTRTSDGYPQQPNLSDMEKNREKKRKERDKDGK